MARVQLNIDGDLWKAARAKAFSDGLSASALVQIALAQFIQWSPQNQARAISAAREREFVEKGLANVATGRVEGNPFEAVTKFQVDAVSFGVPKPAPKTTRRK